MYVSACMRACVSVFACVPALFSMCVCVFVCVCGGGVCDNVCVCACAGGMYKSCEWHVYKVCVLDSPMYTLPLVPERFT